MNTLPLNFKLLGLGVVVLIVGYVLLGQGPVDNQLSWTVAPIVLMVAYCVIIPLSIMMGGSAGKDDSTKKKGV